MNPKAESTWDMFREIRKRCGGERYWPWFTEDERQDSKKPVKKPVNLSGKARHGANKHRAFFKKQ